MKTVHEFQQGAPEWHAHRAAHFNASEAAAMLGIDPKTSRQKLVRMKATGITQEYTDWVQENVLDKGHEFEAMARPIAERIIGEDLYPITASIVIDGLPLSASYDGTTMVEDRCWEHKRVNKELAASVDAGIIPEDKRPQLEQQLLILGADSVMFMVSDGTEETQRHVWYTSDAALRARIIAGWKQFALDVADYTPEPARAPAPTGKTPETLPALRIEVTGMVTASNLAEFKATALAAITSVNRDLKTDADFADAEKAVKWCGDIETRLAAAKSHALSQTTSIDELFRAIDDISAEARRVRLDLSKLVAAEKDNRRTEIHQGGIKRFQDHIAALNARLGKNYMPAIPGVDFAGAIKGKRSLDSMQDAVDTHLANLKIAANEVADKIDGNLKWLREHAVSHAFLFADAAQLVLKDGEAFAAIAQQRIDQHEAAERAKAEVAAEAARERIRAEEAAKLQREQEERERAEREAKAAADKAVQAAQNQPQAAEVHRVAPPQPQPVVAAPEPARAPATPSTPPTLRLGQIGDRLGFNLTGDFLKELGFEPAAIDKRAMLFHEADFPRICRALIEHIESAMETVPA